jgi:hypothetical protein
VWTFPPGLPRSPVPMAHSRQIARAPLSALFSWAIGEGLLDSNPVVGTNKAIDETPRDRVLNSFGGTPAI